MMNKIFSALVSFLVTVVPIILALHQPAVDADGAVGQMSCGLSDSQGAMIKGAIRGIMIGRNESCYFNMTIDEILQN